MLIILDRASADAVRRYRRASVPVEMVKEVMNMVLALNDEAVYARYLEEKILAIDDGDSCLAPLTKSKTVLDICTWFAIHPVAYGVASEFHYHASEVLVLVLVHILIAYDVKISGGTWDMKQARDVAKSICNALPTWVDKKSLSVHVGPEGKKYRANNLKNFRQMFADPNAAETPTCLRNIVMTAIVRLINALGRQDDSLSYVKHTLDMIVTCDAIDVPGPEIIEQIVDIVEFRFRNVTTADDQVAPAPPQTDERVTASAKELAELAETNRRLQTRLATLEGEVAEARSKARAEARAAARIAANEALNEMRLEVAHNKTQTAETAEKTEAAMREMERNLNDVLAETVCQARREARRAAAEAAETQAAMRGEYAALRAEQTKSKTDVEELRTDLTLLRRSCADSFADIKPEMHQIAAENAAKVVGERGQEMSVMYACVYNMYVQLLYMLANNNGMHCVNEMPNDTVSSKHKPPPPPPRKNRCQTGCVVSANPSPQPWS